MKIKPFYVDISGLSVIELLRIVVLIPFNIKDSNYWTTTKDIKYLGCANTYIFTCDSEQGSCFDKLSYDEAINRLKGLENKK